MFVYESTTLPVCGEKLLSSLKHCKIFMWDFNFALLKNREIPKN